jgi:hypothetical protein
MELVAVTTVAGRAAAIREGMVSSAGGRDDASACFYVARNLGLIDLRYDDDFLESV